MDSKPTVNLALLRSQLVQLCPTLKNLTIVDLEACKWNLRRNIYMSLFESNPRLISFHNNLEELLERRNTELAAQKQRKVPRETIVEHEHMYRSSFMNVVLDVLLYMRWPPVLEAFSDNLGQLISDVDFNMAAMAYIASSSLGQGLGPATSTSERGGQDSRGDSSFMSSFPSDSSCSRDLSSDSMNSSAQSQTQSRQPGSGQNKRSDLPPASVPQSSTSDSLVYEQEDEVVSGSSRGMGSISQISQTSSFSIDTSADVPPLPRSSVIMGQQLPVKDIKYEGAQRTVDLLLRQNELLRTRVAQLQHGVNLRADCEDRLEHVLGEVLEVVAGIGDTVGGRTTGADTGNVGSRGSGRSTSSRSGEDRGEDLFAGITFDYGGSAAVVDKGVAAPTNSGSTTSGSAVGWKHVHSRLSKLRNQWVEVRKSVRGGGDFSRGKVSDNSFHEYGHAADKESEAGIMSTGQLHTSVMALGIATSRVIDSLYDYGPASASAIDHSTASRISATGDQTHSQPQALAKSSSNILIDYACDPRICALQRSVVELKDRSDWLLHHLASITPYSAIAGNNNNNSTGSSTNGSTGSNARCNSSAPAYDKYARTSPCLARLVDEVNALSAQRKPNFEQHLPGLIEQSLSENAILMQALGRANSILTQWYGGTAESLTRHLNGLLEGVRRPFGAAVRRLEVLSGQFSQLMALVESAEGARVAVPLHAATAGAGVGVRCGSDRPVSASSNASVASSSSATSSSVARHSPWKALSRGLCGEEMATLLQFLVLYRPKLERYGEELRNTHTQLEADCAAALQRLNSTRERLVDSFDGVGNSIEYLNSIAV